MNPARFDRGRSLAGTLLGALAALALAIGFARPVHGGDPAEVPAAQLPTAQLPKAEGSAADHDADLERFRALLAACQRGEEFDAAQLRASAERLARLHGRTDAPPAAAHYAALSATERAAGWRAFLEFRELWARLFHSDARTWAAERDGLAADLELFLARTAELADRVPHARGLSLRARIAVHDLEGRPRLAAGEGEGEARLAAAGRDARAALEIFEAAGLASPALEPGWLQGRLALLEEDLFEAARRFEGVRSRAQLVRNDDFREHALLGLLLVARRSGDAPRAQRAIAELATFRDPLKSWPLAREHALALLHADHPAEAARFLARAVPAAPAEQRNWSLLSGLAQLRLGELAAARAHLEAPAAAQEESFQLALASLALREGRPAAVVAALEDEALLALFSPQGEMFARSLLGEAQLAQGRPGRAARELERALALAEHWEARLAEQRLLGDATATVMGEWVGLQAVAHLALAHAAEGRPLEAAAAIARAQSRSLRRRLGEGDPSAADLADWAARYEHGLVTWIAGADSGALVWIARDGSAHAAPLARTRSQLVGAVRRLSEAALGADEEDVARLGEELARELFPPALRAQLACSSGGRLLALLHGPLERLPLALLRIEGRPLDELCSPLTLPGLPARRAQELEPALLQRWILAGDPHDAAGRPLLPAAAAELDAVAALRPGSPRIAGPNLNPAALEAALASGACLHLATHAERLPGDARLAPFALSLGRGLYLDAPRIGALAPRAPLVVLSACATADGRFVDAEGLHGLARAFLEGGTRNLLVTLWPVTDAAAAAFAAPYHRALLAGRSPSEAAALARAHLTTTGFPLADQAAFQALGRD